MYVNDLTLALEAAGLGIDLDRMTVSALLYSDDLAFIAENEDDLQCMIDILSKWCRDNKMQANLDKMKVVHISK